MNSDTQPRVNAAHWQASLRGNIAFFVLLARACVRLGRPFGRLLLYPLSAYYFLFAPSARRHSLAYLHRALGRKPSPLDRLRQVFTFASILLDRLYLVGGRYDLYDVTVEGAELMRARVEQGAGAFLMGAHMGSFEIVGAVGRRQAGLKVAMAMFEENARQLEPVRRAAGRTVPIQIIPLGQPQAMLQIKECLDQGGFVGILGDRTMAEQPAQAVRFLGSPAFFPIGPLRLAALLRRPVIFITGLYRGGNRYHVVFEQIADFSSVAHRGERDSHVRAAVERYASVLERCCRSDPCNWLNFYDFWKGAAAPSAAPQRTGPLSGAHAPPDADAG
jgi:predicted LPLAT superfamily acyltransferase